MHLLACAIIDLHNVMQFFAVYEMTSSPKQSMSDGTPVHIFRSPVVTRISDANQFTHYAF